jgi:hypothetical protein
MAKIYSPNKNYTGISASVTFSKGMGETEDEHLKGWFKDHGYKVVEEVKVEVPPVDPPKGPEDDKKDKKPEGSK